MKVRITLEQDDRRRISAPCEGCGHKITIEWPSVADYGRPPMSASDRPVQEQCPNCEAWFSYSMYERDADFWSTPQHEKKAGLAVSGSFEEQQLASSLAVLELMRQCLIQHPQLRVGQLISNMSTMDTDVFYITNKTLCERLAIRLNCYRLREKEDR